ILPGSAMIVAIYNSSQSGYHQPAGISKTGANADARTYAVPFVIRRRKCCRAIDRYRPGSAVIIAVGRVYSAVAPSLKVRPLQFVLVVPFHEKPDAAIGALVGIVYGSWVTPGSRARTNYL